MAAGLAQSRPWVLGLMLLPACLFLVTTLLIPMGFVVDYSFSQRGDYGGVVPGFTIQNYAALIDAKYLTVAWNSLEVAGLTTLGCILLGYPLAWMIAFRAGRWAPVLLVLLLIPFWTNFLIRISAWLVLLGYRGLINAGLLESGLLEAPVRMLGTQGAVLAGLIYAFLPIAVFPIYAALRPIPRHLREAADDLGAGPFQSFRRVVWPLSLPGVIAAALFVFVPSMGVFAIPVLLGGGKELILGNLIYNQMLEFRNMPAGAAVSIVLLILSLAGIAVTVRLMARLEAARS